MAFLVCGGLGCLRWCAVSWFVRCSPLNWALNCNRGWWVIKVDIYDVFIGESAFGNPCAVLELNDWLPDSESFSSNT